MQKGERRGKFLQKTFYLLENVKMFEELSHIALLYSPSLFPFFPLYFFFLILLSKKSRILLTESETCCRRELRVLQIIVDTDFSSLLSSAIFVVLVCFFLMKFFSFHENIDLNSTFKIVS